MKGIRKRLTAVLLACTVFMTGVLGRCQPVKAAFVLPATEAGIAAGQTLQWLYTVLLSMGIAINLKEMIRYRDPTDGYQWLDEPAAQEDINNLERKLWKEYDEAVEKYLREHPNGSTPTPEPTKTPDPTQAPETSPPAKVTPAPTSVPPEILDKIDSWAEMRQKALQNKVLALGAGAAVCLKEAVSNWWDEVMDTESQLPAVEENKYSYSDCIGYYEVEALSSDGRNLYRIKTWGYSLVDNPISYLLYSTETSGANTMHFFKTEFGDLGYYQDYRIEFLNSSRSPYRETKSSHQSVLPALGSPSGWQYVNENYHFYVPVKGKNGNEDIAAETKPLTKPVIWPVPSLKGDYDNNNSPTLPTVPVPIIIPGLDEIQELNKNANDSDDDNRPTIIQNFINNHTAKDPTPTPQPTPSTTPAVVPDPDPGTDPDPDPTGAPDPDPNPTAAPEATPNPTPAIPVDPDVDPKPSTAPKPNPTGSPDNPGTDDVDPEKYKTDLRLVFPFCIPFDLVHLIKAFEAEPEAPVFEFPFDLDLENPFTGEKVLDYHHTFKLDMSDYEPVIKIFRIFEIIFFIIALLLITRQQMIKG